MHYRLPRLLVVVDDWEMKQKHSIILSELESMFEVTYKSSSTTTQGKQGEKEELGKILHF